jgi:hypothetical protein
MTAVLTFVPADAHAAAGDDAAADYGVSADNYSDAVKGCVSEYGAGGRVPDAFTYVDCVNAAAAYFYGAGHHTRYWNV